jgi:hypothetical protein
MVYHFAFLSLMVTTIMSYIDIYSKANAMMFQDKKVIVILLLDLLVRFIFNKVIIFFILFLFYLWDYFLKVSF